MNNAEYIQNCIRTEAPITEAMLERFSNKRNIRLIHAAFGLQTESAELTDMLKKSMFYGKPLDVVNLLEEAQDCLWYISLLFDELGYTYEKAMETNIKKLAARYPDKFSEFHAENRDLETERAILETHDFTDSEEN